MSKIFYLFPFLAFSIFTTIMVTTNNHPKKTTEEVNEMVSFTAKKTNTESNK
jgi:hypothetical protein